MTKFNELFATVFVAILLAGCGSSSDPAAIQGPSVNVTLAPLATQSQKETEGQVAGQGSVNLLDMSRSWSSWGGQPSAITYDAVNNNLRIPAPDSGDDLVIGVQRYRVALNGSYSLTVTTNNDDLNALVPAAAMVFLFNEAGSIIPITAQDSFLGQNIIAARDDGVAVTFDAPPGTAGFFVQVQSGWQATTPATMVTRLVGPGTPQGENLVTINGPWQRWSAEPEPLISYNDLIARVRIKPPADAQGATLGVQWIDQTLQAGAQYTVSIDLATKPGASILLFLLDDSGNVIGFTDPATDQTTPWIAATARQDNPVFVGGGPGFAGTQSFIAPAGVARVVVQIQGPWNDTDDVWIIPALRITDDNPLACGPRQTGLSRLAAADGSDINGDVFNPSISQGGRYIAFASDASNLVADGDTQSTVTHLFVHDRQQGRTERITPVDATGASTEPVISGDGQTIAFYSAATNLSDGIVDDNGAEADLFTYNRQSENFVRIVALNGTGSDRISLSADGQKIAFASKAANLIETQTDPNGVSSDVFVYDAALNSVRRASSGELGVASGSPFLNGDGNRVVFHASSAGPSGTGENPTRRDIQWFDLDTGTRERISGDGYPSISVSFDPVISNNARYVAHTFMENSRSTDVRVINLTDGSWREFSGASNASISTSGQALAWWAPDAADSFESLFVYDQNSQNKLRVISGRGQLPASLQPCPLCTGAPGTPSLSADGKVIVFESNRAKPTDNLPNAHNELYIAQVEYPCR